MTLFDAETTASINSWLDGPYDSATKAKIMDMLRSNQADVASAFYKKLQFGTAGVRAVMGVGPSRLNEYTIGHMAQGLMNYLRATYAEPSIFISYDSRNRSQEFAEVTAAVAVANGVKVYLTEHLRPTPLVSFGILHCQASCGVMITASHNPPEYNGFKVYNDRAHQVLGAEVAAIVAAIEAVAGPHEVCKVTLPHPLLSYVGEELDAAYLAAARTYAISPDTDQREGGSLRGVYTPLHGTGSTLVPALLRDWGFTNIELLSKQASLDPEFSTVSSPNPEEPAAFDMAISMMRYTQAEIAIATDPDADRLGVCVVHKDRPQHLTGNQILCLAADFICRRKQLPANAAFVKTIVTTELFAKIVHSYGHTCFDVLTGFKYIGELIAAWKKSGQHTFIFGGEESYGYLLGEHAGDKDGCILAGLVCEMALEAKLAGLSLVDQWEALQVRFGRQEDVTLSLSYPAGKDGMQAMAAVMQRLRSDPPESLQGFSVVARRDYMQAPSNLPLADVLEWQMKQATVRIRPSGTEPKIKIYISASCPDILSSFSLFQDAIKNACR